MKNELPVLVSVNSFWRLAQKVAATKNEDDLLRLIYKFEKDISLQIQKLGSN